MQGIDTESHRAIEGRKAGALMMTYNISYTYIEACLIMYVTTLAQA